MASLLCDIRWQIYLKSQRKYRHADRVSFNREQFQLRLFQISSEHLNGFLDRERKSEMSLSFINRLLFIRGVSCSRLTMNAITHFTWECVYLSGLIYWKNTWLIRSSPNFQLKTDWTVQRLLIQHQSYVTSPEWLALINKVFCILEAWSSTGIIDIYF